MWMKPLADLGEPNLAMQAAVKGDDFLYGYKSSVKLAIRGFIVDDEEQGRNSMFLDASPSCCYMRKDAETNSLVECAPTDDIFKAQGYYYLKVHVKWIYFKKPLPSEDDEMIGKLKFELTQVHLNTMV